MEPDTKITLTDIVPSISCYIAFVTLELEDGQIVFNSLIDTPYLFVSIHQDKKEFKGVSSYYEVAYGSYGYTADPADHDRVEGSLVQYLKQLRDLARSKPNIYQEIPELERSVNLQISSMLGLDDLLANLSALCLSSHAMMANSFTTLGNTDAR